MSGMISLEQARELVLSHVSILDIEEVDVLDAVGRVSAADLTSDIDVAPFPHAAMDGFALHASDIAQATHDAPIELDVVAEIGAGDVYTGSIESGQCVRIMTGACLPADADAVVKYEVVDAISGEGRTGGRVSFSEPTTIRANIRGAGEEARCGEVVVHKGELITTAGVGFLAGCGILSVPVYRRPRVAIAATGSELVDASEVPTPGHIRNSNSYAIAACASAAGAIPEMLPIVEDTYDALANAVRASVGTYDFVITTGGAANGDFDFIKPVVDDLGELLMTTVNMRPGKAQTFGLVCSTPVFGLPGNPAAAYCGFEMIIRPALRKMQGFTHFERPCVQARLSTDVKKKDPRRIYLRATLTKDDEGYVVTPATNQSSGLFGPIQRGNCMAIMPEGLESRTAGSFVDCVLLDVSEEVVL